MKWFLRGVAVASRIAPGTTARWLATKFQSPNRLEGKAWETAVEARGERFWIDETMSAIRWGTGDRTVFLIHGWEGRATQFEAFVDPLVAGGFEVIAIDGPGHGASPGERANPFIFADALKRAQATLGEPYAVIGHSMGGAATLIATSEGLAPTKVVTLGAPTDIVQVLHRFCALLRLPPGVRTGFLEHMRVSSGRDPEKIAPASLAPYLLGRDGLLVHADNDDEVPFDEAPQLAALWPEARVRPAPGLGHRRIMRDAGVVNDVVAFLGR